MRKLNSETVLVPANQIQAMHFETIIP